MPQGKADPSWWGVVKSLADFVVLGHSEEDLIGVEVKEKLIDSGHHEDDISEAYKWLDKVMLSGSLSESLSMLKPTSHNCRIENPIETLQIPDSLWKGIQVCRIRGFLSDDLIERLLDEISMIDTRNWDDDETRILLIELLGVVIPGFDEDRYLKILDGSDVEFYC